MVSYPPNEVYVYGVPRAALYRSKLEAVKAKSCEVGLRASTEPSPFVHLPPLVYVQIRLIH